MKRTFIALLTAICMFAASDSYAQGRPYRPVRHHGSSRYDTGVELSIGYLHSGYRTKSWVNDEVGKDAGLNGLSLGVTKDFTIIRNVMYFQTGLSYQFQTSSNKYTKNVMKVVEERNEHYLDIPLRLKFAMDVLPEVRAFVYLGPTLDFGLSAKLQGRLKGEGDDVAKITYNYFNGKVKGSSIGEFALGTPASAYRAFDVFLGGAVGVELYDIAVVKLGMDWGIINRNKNQAVADQFTTRRNLFHLGVGVKF